MATASPSSTSDSPSGKRKKGGFPPNAPDFIQAAAELTQDVGRSLPHSTEAELALLSSIVIAPDEVLTTCLEKLNPDCFHLFAHRTLYELLVELWDKSHAIDPITLTQELRDRGLLDKIGGPAFVSELFTYTPSAANASYYSDIVVDKYLLRSVISACTECTTKAYEQSEDVDGLLDSVEQQIFKISENRFKTETRTMQHEVMDAIKTIEELYANKGQTSGLSTGFKDLDNMTSGLHAAEMFVVAARPSMGKTAFAMNVAEHVALNEGKSVAVFSLEMSTQQLVQRLLCSVARVNLKSTRDGFLSKQDFPKLVNAASTLGESKFIIDDTPGISILELRAKARRMKAQHDIDLIVIDYLQLLKSSSRRAQDNRQLEIAEISAGVKALAKELNIPIIVLAQLNRSPEQRTGGIPRLSDLRESGSIEQDADIVGLLVRSEYYKDEEDAEAVEGEAKLIIAKQRNGPVGDVPLTFRKEFTRFENRAWEVEEH